MKFEEIDEYVRRRCVGGWILAEERHALYEIAKSLGGPIIELGCYRGLSTLYLAAGLEANGSDSLVWAVDNFKGQTGKPHKREFWAEPAKVEAIFRRNISDAGLEKWIKVFIGDTLAPVSIFDDETVSVLFIDGDHRYEVVRADYCIWYRKVKLGGKIMMHDAIGCGGRVFKEDGVEYAFGTAKVDHPGVMAVFAGAVLRREIRNAIIVGTMGIGDKPEKPKDV